MHLLSDFCNRVNNSSNIRLDKTLVKNSKLIKSTCFTLYRLGYILNFSIKNFKHISVFLKYYMGGSVIRKIFSLSRPSIKFYIKCKKIIKFSNSNFFGSIGFMGISTNKGKIMLDFECLLNNCGGKPIWAVY